MLSRFADPLHISNPLHTAFLTYTEGCWWGWAGAAHCFVTAAERMDGALACELHDKHDMQST